MSWRGERERAGELVTDCERAAPDGALVRAILAGFVRDVLWDPVRPTIAAAAYAYALPRVEPELTAYIEGGRDFARMTAVFAWAQPKYAGQFFPLLNTVDAERWTAAAGRAIEQLVLLRFVAATADGGDQEAEPRRKRVHPLRRHDGEPEHIHFRRSARRRRVARRRLDEAMSEQFFVQAPRRF